MGRGVPAHWPRSTRARNQHDGKGRLDAGKLARGRRHTACIVTPGGSSPPGWVGDSRCGHPRTGSRSERALFTGCVHWEMCFPSWQGFFETRSLDILTCQFCHQRKKQLRHSGPAAQTTFKRDRSTVLDTTRNDGKSEPKRRKRKRPKGPGERAGSTKRAPVKGSAGLA